MLKKKISTLLVALLVVMQCVYGTNLLFTAHAAPISGNIIDSVTMTVYNGAGQAVTDTVYEQGAKVRLDYTWSLPNGHGYKNNDVFTFTLPQQFLLFNDINGSLVNEDEDVGTFSVNAGSHQVTMVFNDNIETHDDVRGTLTFMTQFDVKTVTGSTTQIIKIPVNGGEQVFTLRFKPKAATAITKSGVPQGYNAKSIDWIVDINKTLDTVQNATVTDPMPAGLSVPVTVAVYDLGVNLDGSVTQGALVDTSKYTVSTAGNNLQVTFADTVQSAYRIWFTTPVTDADRTSFTNTATFGGSNQTPSQASAAVTVQRGAHLDKSSSGYQSDTQTINWDIKYNYNEKTIAQADAHLTDLFDNTHQLVPGSIRVYPVTLNQAGAETLGAELPASQYTVDPATASSKNGFKLQFAGPVSSAYKISYQTQAVGRVVDNGSVTNEVTSGGGKSDTATQNFNQVVIVKNTGAADYQAKTVAWSIELNKDSQAMNNVEVTDTFPNKGLEFLPGTLVVKQGTTVLNAPADYTLDNLTAATDGFKLTFSQPLAGPVSISYKTAFHPDWISPAGSTSDFNNTASVAWTDNAAKAWTKTVTSTFTPRAEVKSNGFKNGSYNATSKQITWTVGVNYNSKTLNSAVVEDLLESGQKLVDSSLAVYNMTIPANGNPSRGSEVDPSAYQYSVGNDNKLTVTFKQPISTPYSIIFTTSLEGELINNKVNNTAVLLDGTDPASKSLTASVTIPQGGEYVNKSGVQNGDKINWTIHINRGQSSVADAKITDTPSENQLLLPDTFHLFGTTVQPNGTVVKGTELVKGTDYNVTISTDDNGKQSFVLAFLKPISTAYLLEYQSLIVANDKDTVSNKVAFSGNNVIAVTKDTATDIVVGVSSGSGTSSGVRGTLTVKKTDSADGTVLLSGATFELYRKSGSTKSLINTATTDATGTVVFKKLLAGDYIVKETVAPAGYVLDSREHPVTINSTAGFTLNLTNARVPTPTPSATPSVKPSVSPSATPSASPSVKPSVSPSVTPSASPSTTPSATPSATPSPTPDSSDSSESSSSPTPSPSLSPSPAAPSPSSSHTPSPSPAATPSPSSGTAAPTPTPGGSPDITPSGSPAPATPAPTPVVEHKETTQDTPIEGHIDLPLGGIPSVKEQPANGTLTVEPNGDWKYVPNPGFVGKDKGTITVRDKDGKEQDIFVDVDVQAVPLGVKQEKALPMQTLPKTGEESRLYLQVGGILLILLGFLLRKRFIKAK